ncbi:MAG TPA: hypothetical protein VGL72_02110 [Bryobacteraceae bacterium]
MHPHTFYTTLFEHEKRNEVFVIMSFADELSDRWCRILAPLIQDDLHLTPIRIDDTNSGESVVSDILDGIAHARLILADITAVLLKDNEGRESREISGNVMWELGIAHVMRMPDEVVLVRSDQTKSLFDLTPFRAFQYDPNEVSASRRYLGGLCRDRLASINQTKSLAVRRCAESLDYTGWAVLGKAAASPDGIEPPLLRTMGQALGNSAAVAAIARLLELGALSTSFTRIDAATIGSINLESPAEQFLRYRITSFGVAVVKYIAERMVDMTPESVSRLQRAIRGEEPNVPPDGVVLHFP